MELIPVGLEGLLGYFAYSHLPPHLQSISKPFHILAHDMVGAMADNDELRAGLRKLLEAKDCMVRAAISADAPGTPKNPDTYRIEVHADMTPDAIGAALAEAVAKRRKIVP